MAVRILPYDTPTFRLFEEIVFTYAKLKAHPLGAPFVEPFQAKIDECSQLILAELHLTVRRVSAQAVVELIDENLNDIVDGIDNVTDIKNEVMRRFRELFFGTKPPSAFKKPILGAQLAAQRSWLGPLQSPDTPGSLQKYAPSLSLQVKAADEALQERDAANQESRDFKTIGAKFKFIDALNTLRKNTYNELDKLPSKTPELKRDFASRFFLKRSGGYASESLEEERERLQTRANELREELSEIEVRLAQIEEERTKLAAQEATRQAIDEEMEEMERRLEELKAKRAKLS